MENSLRYQIINSTIQNASAEIGGAIYAANNQNLSISGCTFINNAASQGVYNSISGAGGAIYYTCDTDYLCKLIIDNQTSFIGNEADL